jgi:hypothetical protein
VGATPTLDTDLPQGAAAALRTPAAVRERARQLLQRAREGASRWFSVHDEALPGAADMVADITRSRYPDLKIPYHSRWRHFEAGGVDRKADLLERISALDASDRARVMIDLTVVSVLLDAGSGAVWHYREADTGQCFTRSEGLAVASYHAFVGGLFSSDNAQPLQVDAAGLRGLTTERLAEAFQVDGSNVLVGLESRVLLLHRLGDSLAAQPDTFGPQARPGRIFDLLVPPSTVTVDAPEILSRILTSLSAIWLTGTVIGDQPLGDCWRHEAVTGPGLTQGWMPFHKLSQWLSYSLVEPFNCAGVHVDGLDALTGLPEYRNGGLLVDTGALRPKQARLLTDSFKPGDEAIVEWRALTVALLDQIAAHVRLHLGMDAAQLPLVKVLEAGTWFAGRVLAAERRPGGGPPIAVESDGTVF